MQLLLTSIDHYNISLLTIISMPQHTGMEVFDHSSYAESFIQYQISIPDTQYLLKLTDMNLKTDTNTDNIIIRTSK